MGHGGYGAEHAGDPFGLGGPLNVVRARAIKGQVVRVVFDEEPVHRSAAGINDALNPSNYGFTVLQGQASPPQAVGVDEAMVIGPAPSVQAGDERGFDVHTDKPLVVGLHYRVRASGILSKQGGALGAPYQADFWGMVILQETQPPARRADFVDIANDAFDGRLPIDGGGDYAVHGGLDSLKKRIYRRLVTVKNSFACLPVGYGVGLKLKELASVAQILALKGDIIQQVKQEPEVADCNAVLQLLNPELLIVRIPIKTKAGVGAELSMSFSPTGGVIL